LSYKSVFTQLLWIVEVVADS